MEGIFGVAYYAALLLWIPLGIIAASKPSALPRVMTPLVFSAIGAAYEAWMRSAYPQMIRIDIFLAMFVLNLVDAVSGAVLLAVARGRPDRGALRLAAGLCLGVAALGMAAYVEMRTDMGRSRREVYDAWRLHFETYFRDDAAQRRAFGDLAPSRNPWAGYYAKAGGDDDRFAHLVVNDEGRFWIFHSALNSYAGAGAPNATGDAFEGAGDDRRNVRMRMTLRHGEGGLHELLVDFGTTPRVEPKPAPMRRTDPPRFPRPHSASDEVRFAGVFSAIHRERPESFSLTQVWLWESKGEWWGEYVRNRYVRGASTEFISTAKLDAACSEGCRVLSFKAGEMPVKLTRVSDDELGVEDQADDNGVTLKRGEILPGFYYDLAPLATKKENREWVKAMGGMISWRVPAAGSPLERSSR